MAGILIVEDDTTINEMVARNLKMVGHKCTQVYDGKEGLEMIENGDFDLVLLDVMLPGMAGFEIMEKTNIAPLMTEAMQRGTEKPEAFATAMPMGTISVIVPTEVPMARDTRQLTMKSTATANCGGIRERMK